MNASEGPSSGGSTARGILIGVLIMLGILALLAGLMFLAMGRCPMCGGMMTGGLLPLEFQQVERQPLTQSIDRMRPIASAEGGFGNNV